MFKALRQFLAQPSDFAWHKCELPLFGGRDGEMASDLEGRRTAA
jgi:hypothetical protein